jgi:hypothetical protein
MLIHVPLGIDEALASVVIDQHEEVGVLGLEPAKALNLPTPYKVGECLKLCLRLRG